VQIQNSRDGNSRPLRRQKIKLSYVRTELLPILPLNGLHLVFEPQFQLFKPDFLQLFVFAEISFLGE
jgi:hypothetical protein